MTYRWTYMYSKQCKLSVKTALCIGALSFLPLTAQALLQACAVVTGGVAFGSYSFINAAPAAAVGNLQITCSLSSGLAGETVSYDISLSTGNSGSYLSRSMTSGIYQLQYNLYTQSGANTPVWGDGTSSTSTVQDSYTLALLGTTVRNYPVYGYITSGQNKPIGAYVDNLTVTVNY